MKRVLTISELMDKYDWEAVCAVKEWSVWCVSEGQADEDEEVSFTEEEWDLVIDPPGPMYDHPRQRQISVNDWMEKHPSGYAQPTELVLGRADFERMKAVLDEWEPKT